MAFALALQYVLCDAVYEFIRKMKARRVDDCSECIRKLRPAAIATALAAVIEYTTIGSVRSYHLDRESLSQRNM